MKKKDIIDKVTKTKPLQMVSSSHKGNLQLQFMHFLESLKLPFFSKLKLKKKLQCTFLQKILFHRISSSTSLVPTADQIVAS